jgi:hypothetical protein
MEYFQYNPILLLIFPVIIFLIGIKLYVLDNAKKTDAGLFSIWVEVETINDHQTKVVKKYSFSKWCYLILTIYKTDKDYYHNL